MPNDRKPLTIRSVRISVLMGVFAALAISANSSAATPLKWHWLTVAQNTYAIAPPGPIRVRLTTGAVLEWPTQAADTGFLPSFPDHEARMKMLVGGVKAGTRVSVTGSRTCSTASDPYATTVAENVKQYSFNARAGTAILLPAAIQGDHDGFACTWSLTLIAPSSKLSLQLSVYTPLAYVRQDLAGGIYDRESCAFVVSKVADSRSCAPLP